MTTMPSGVVQFSASTWPPGADLAAARSQAAWSPCSKAGQAAGCEDGEVRCSENVAGRARAYRPQSLWGPHLVGFNSFTLALARVAACIDPIFHPRPCCLRSHFAVISRSRALHPATVPSATSKTRVTTRRRHKSDLVPTIFSLLQYISPCKRVLPRYRVGTVFVRQARNGELQLC